MNWAALVSQFERGATARWGSLALCGTFVCAGLGLPLALVLAQGLAPASPLGFGQQPLTLLHIAKTSLVTAVIPAIVAATMAVGASCLGVFSAVFQRVYRIWIFALLFTNPVFLVLGLAVLSADLPARIAVISVTALVLMPVVALPIQAAADQVRRSELDAARALGSRASNLLWRHLLPSLWSSVIVAAILGAVFALGFYLLPTFVGYGRVSTLGSLIYSVLNRLGDFVGAAQLAIILLVLEFLLITVAILLFIVVRGLAERLARLEGGRA
jgi:ABC-type spermidine/putrescine transport system permease subunit I